MLARLGGFDFPKRNLRSLFAMQKDDGFVGHMIFRKQVLRASHADRIRRVRLAYAVRCAGSINELPRLAALDELDQIALLTWRQTEFETGVVMVDHIQERRETTVVEEAALRPRPEATELRRNHGAADRPRRPTVGLEGVDAHLDRRVRVVAGIGVESGGMWHSEHLPWPLKTASPRFAAALSKLAAGGVGACSESW